MTMLTVALAVVGGEPLSTASTIRVTIAGDVIFSRSIDPMNRISPEALSISKLSEISKGKANIRDKTQIALILQGVGAIDVFCFDHSAKKEATGG